MLDSQLLLDKLKALPPSRLAEVEDFIDFLIAREKDASLKADAAQTSTAAFGSIWRNPEDDIYDEL